MKILLLSLRSRFIKVKSEMGWEGKKPQQVHIIIHMSLNVGLLFFLVERKILTGKDFPNKYFTS